MRFRGVLVLAATAVALATPTGAAASPASQLENELGAGVNVDGDAETGRQVTFIGTDPGVTIPLAAEAPRAAAAEAVAQFGSDFGLRKGADFEVTDVNRIDDGRAAVRVQQTIGGVPVIGGQLVVNLDPSGELLSISGELEPASDLDTNPAVSEAEADDAAFAAVAKTYEISPDELKISDSELSIFDSRIMGGPGLEIPSLVWRFEVINDAELTTIREFVLVDAELGNVALSFSNIHEAKNRQICDAVNNPAGEDLPCLAPDRIEGGSGAGLDPNVNLAYDFSGGVYDFYLNRFGRDSINGAGMNLISTVRYCNPSRPCPYANAFWNGSQMAYGDGLVTDDIAGHEMTHGVTESESGLFYYYQSGAIDESLSDVFGELYDFAEVDAGDTAANRWLLGEDSVLGAIRDMENPPNAGAPDRMGSSLYFFTDQTDRATGDAGGVHVNSGVNNKAAFLLTDGGTFNGQTVSALGETKVGQLYYDVNTNLLNSASDYQDLANAMSQACSTLAGAGTAGFTAADCTEVNEVLLATEMDQEPANAPAPEAAICPYLLESPIDTFFDNLENTASGNWVTTLDSGAQSWFYPQNSNPFGFNATYATSGTTNFWAYDRSTASDTSIEMTSNVTIPPNGLMHFSHAYGFEMIGATREDGGILEYSTDNGLNWLDAGPIMAENGYNGTLAAGNPIGAIPAFSGESKGYQSTRVDLSSLADQAVRFRFTQGTDAGGFDYGWFIDDIRIYNANCPPETIIDSGPDEGSTIQVKSTSIGFSATDPAARLECSFDGAGFTTCTSPANLGPLAEGRHSLAVRAVDTEGLIEPTPTTRSFTVDTRCPRALAALKAAKKKLKKAKKKLKKAEQDGASKDAIERLEKKVKKAKKKVKRAKRLARSVCP